MGEAYSRKNGSVLSDALSGTLDILKPPAATLNLVCAAAYFKTANQCISIMMQQCSLLSYNVCRCPLQSCSRHSRKG